MSNEETRIVEVNGIKMEIDLRHAKRVEKFKIGDPVKVLVKHYDKYNSYAGVIVGFDAFEKRPTIIVCYIKAEYSETTLEFIYVHKDTEDVEIVQADPHDIPFSKAEVLTKLDREIMKMEESVKDLQQKKAHFLRLFDKYFEAEQQLAKKVDEAVGE